MDYISLLFLILGLLSTIRSENSDEESKESLPIVVRSAEENRTSDDVEVSVRKTGLSSKTLSELHDLAKNISHSKGIYRETDNESPSELELRRSFLKKATVASESDTMRVILEKFNSDENKLDLLQHLEYLVHQYDVAVNFAAAGGIEILVPFLFSPDNDIVSSVAAVLGAAMQSNPTVQKLAMKSNIITALYKLLSDKFPNTLSRIIFALSSLLRTAPVAQQEFIAIDGISKLADILKSHLVTTNTKLKIINLLNDLGVEQQTAEFDPNGRSSEEIQKFQRLFAHKMQSSDSCKIIPLFLDLEDFDTHEKVVSAMISLYSVCDEDFKTVAISNRLNKLLKIYNPEAEDENPLYPNIDKDLKQNLYSDIKILFKKIKEQNANKYGTESKLKMEL